jgi:3-isopropylmalate dehydrogenase
MRKKIAILAGDGIGPEVMQQTLRALETLLPDYFEFCHALIGGAAFESDGTHFPPKTEQICKESDAILFGSVGGPINQSHLDKWKNCETNSILALRKAFGFSANLRPIKVFPALREISPLRSEILGDKTDLVIVRELLGDIYFGEHKQENRNGIRWAFDGAEYTESQITDVAIKAFELAKNRNCRLCSVDKANVLSTSKLWRTVVTEISANYPEVTLEHMLVDNCAMQIIRDPQHFDVILTSNMFGDILSDAAAVIPGSLGLTPSASLNNQAFGLYEPSGGSAPDIAGKNLANPIAQLLSAALMLRISFAEYKAADRIESAIEKTLNLGIRTKDVSNANSTIVSCSEFIDYVLRHL